MTQSFNNTTIANELYPVANAITSSNPFVVVFQTRAPTIYDIQYPIQKIWLDTSVGNFWFLQNFTTASGQVFANWVPCTSAVTTESLHTDDGMDVLPNPATGEINLFGDGVYIKTTGNPGTNTVNINGIAGAIVSKFTVDAHTAPGTNPVVPDATGNVTITGGQVAAGVIPNIIRTDSLAPNTYTVEIQRSQAVSSSTLGFNGVSHFNSADFTVDANGFVSAINLPSNTAFNYTNVVGPTTYTVNVTTPPVDYYISCDTTAGAVTLTFPNVPTFKQLWVVKDRRGNATVNNISITTVGGANTFDGQAIYKIAGNWGSVNILANNNPNANGNYYEIW